jgi:hypothetical protein
MCHCAPVLRIHSTASRTRRAIFSPGRFHIDAAKAWAAPGVRKWLGEEAAGANEVGCRILRNLLKNLRARLNAAPTAMAGYF